MIRLTAALPLLALPVLAIGCATPGDRAGNNGACPAGETCSDDTPNGLYFLGTSVVGELDGGPKTTAIGGTQEITVETEQSTIGDYAPLTLPFVADDDGGLGVKVVTHTGAIVSVTGVATRSNYLRILSQSTGELYDRVKLDGAAVDNIVLTGADYEGIEPGLPVVWATGEQFVGIALLGAVQGSSGPQADRLVDTSMTITAAGSDLRRWDTIHFVNASVGVTSVHIAAGAAAPTDLALEFVDHADAIMFDDEVAGASTVEAGGIGFVCFRAMNGARYIHGLNWTFTVDGTLQTQGQTGVLRNCFEVDAATKQVGDIISVIASAGGKSSSLEVHVVADPDARVNPTKHSAWRTARGERALALTK